MLDEMDFSDDMLYTNGIQPSNLTLERFRKVPRRLIEGYQKNSIDFLTKYDRFHPVNDTICMQNNLFIMWNILASRFANVFNWMDWKPNQILIWKLRNLETKQYKFLWCYRKRAIYLISKSKFQLNAKYSNIKREQVWNDVIFSWKWYEFLSKFINKIRILSTQNHTFLIKYVSFIPMCQ